MKLWGGRFTKEMDAEVLAFTSSFQVDQRLWEVDLTASVAHARMLGEQGILTQDEAAQLVRALNELKTEIGEGLVKPDPQSEDIHSAIEKLLYAKLGALAGKLHTARSRSDRVGKGPRLYLRETLSLLSEEIRNLQGLFLAHAEKHPTSLLPGMTHFQHAQPVSLAHHLLTYFWMLERDVERLDETSRRTNRSPLGAAALAGTGFPLDRQMTARELGFSEVIPNSLDAVSDRDFVIEFLSDGSLLMMHLSRFCEELIIWSSPEFAFVELGDEVTTGSSIMPQKKNPDVAELIRGRVGQLYGSLMGALTMMKGLPLAYNRDMQEDKVFLFQGLDLCLSSVRMMSLMLGKAQWKTERMAAALAADFSNATDLADDLVRKGLPFREAHEVIGRLVRFCLETAKPMETLTLNELRQLHPLFDEQSVHLLPHLSVMQARVSEGGTSSPAVQDQLKKARQAWVSRGRASL